MSAEFDLSEGPFTNGFPKDVLAYFPLVRSEYNLLLWLLVFLRLFNQAIEGATPKDHWLCGGGQLFSETTGRCVLCRMGTYLVCVLGGYCLSAVEEAHEGAIRAYYVLLGILACDVHLFQMR